jgi:hypothetical protein
MGAPIKKTLKPRFCEFCGIEFVPSSNSRRFCGGSCRSKHTMIGRKLSPEWKKAISLGNIGRENHNFYSRGNSGFRSDLNKFFRSNWEANIARIFNHLDIIWKYEDKDSRVFLSTCSYLPDFFLPELKIYVEVKGYNRDNKLKMLHQEKPDFPIKIIDCEVYTKLSVDFSSKIENWEQ